ncbi:MAG: response regulator transcription factor [Campylobacterales bacterium]|nr:response regulator transcription factor [Campylobacterales bacterium]
MNDLILIIEDDAAIAALLERSLKEHYKTLCAASLKEAKLLLQTHTPQLILLDLGLPDGDGKSLIPLLRRALQTPIIVVSARHEEREIVAALDLGADDYVTKPFSLVELMARVRRAQRRALMLSDDTPVLTCNDLTLDLERHRCILKEVPIKLTPTEFSLMRLFMAHQGQVLTHQQILKQVWGVGYQQGMQYLRSYINTLRKKIETDPARPRYIQTELGIGYRFCCHHEGV